MRRKDSHRETRYLIRHKASGRFFGPTTPGALLHARREVMRNHDWYRTEHDAREQMQRFARPQDYEVVPVGIFQTTAEVA